MSRVVLALLRDVAEASDLIVELRARKVRLQIAAEEARSVPRQRRQLLDSAAVIAVFAEEMDEISQGLRLRKSLTLQVQVPWADG